MQFYEKEKVMKKRKLLPILLALVMVLTMIPAAVFAGNETITVSNGIWVNSETTQQEIDEAWGEGVASVSQQNGVYTIKFLKNLTMTTAYLPISIGVQNGGNDQPMIILDLNGCTITSNTTVISNYGNLTIKDSLGTGRVLYNGNAYLCAVNNNGYKMIIEGGNFECQGAGSAMYNAAISSSANTTTIINGGNFEGNNAGALITYGEVVINNGTFEGKYGVVSKKGSSSVGSITFSEECNAVINAESTAFVVHGDGNSDGHIYVAGGTYNASNIVGKLDAANTAEAVSITGGIYEKDPSAWVSDDIAVANLTASGGENPSAYAVGGNDISILVSGAEKGDEIDILSGSIELTEIDDGVVIKNSGTGTVTVNGEVVTGGNSVTVCNHTWGDPVWKWEADNSAATASFTCEKDQTHTETVDAVISKEVTTPATCTNEGITTYTATVEFNGKTYTDVKSLSNIAKIAHTYKDGKCIVCGAVDPEYKSDSSAQTGDDFNMAIPFVAAGLALAAMAAVVATRKRHN